jgi:glucose-6-phosphate isomerase
MERLSSSPAWRALLAHRDTLAPKHLRDFWEEDGARGEKLTFSCAGIAADFSKQRITAETLELLVALARERELTKAIERLFTGERVNVSENRPALHTALRGEEHVLVDGVDIREDVQRQRERVRVVANAVRDGLWKGATGKPLTHVIALGIGGSSLGPRVVVEALRAQADGPEVRFVSNIDPAELDDALRGLDPASTMAVVASKTFTTQETMANAAAVQGWFTNALGAEAVAKHMVAATANTEGAVRWGLPECNVFPFGEWVGGRYSVWSSVGLPVAMAIGMADFERLLAGAHAVDLEFRSTPLDHNVPALMALVGIWNRNALGAATHAVLTYGSRLANFTMYLQQLEMESLGKRVDEDGQPGRPSDVPRDLGRRRY